MVERTTKREQTTLWALTNEKYIHPLQRQKGGKKTNGRERERERGGGGGMKGENKIKLESEEERRARLREKQVIQGETERDEVCEREGGREREKRGRREKEREREKRGRREREKREGDGRETERKREGRNKTRKREKSQCQCWWAKMAAPSCKPRPKILRCVPRKCRSTARKPANCIRSLSLLVQNGE